VSSGSVLLDLQRYPKIVGGIDDASGERAGAFYREMLDANVTVVRDAETAEFSKLAETTYRDVNIALANEFAQLAGRLGVDVAQAIAAANSQPYSHIHTPGLGVGGHCIPVYPYFLAGEDTPLIANARRTNDAMATYGADLLASALGTLAGATVVILGLSYRANVKESRHSSALLLAEALGGRGARVLMHDPLYSDDEIRAHGLTPPPSFPLPADAIAVQAWHAAYGTLDFAVFAGLRAVLDGRGVLGEKQLKGTEAKLIGMGTPSH
jgi:nucleotide sugar dehydrogenase